MFTGLREYNRCHNPAGHAAGGGRFARRNTGICHTVPGGSRPTARVQPTVRMDENARRAWRRAFGDSKVTPEDIVNAYASPHTRATALITVTESGMFTVQVEQDDALSIRQLKPHPRDAGKWLAYHEAFLLNDSAQGKGTAKQVLAETLRVYQQMGVADIILDANIDVGSYAWARYGFDFAGTPSQAFTFRTVTRQRADTFVKMGVLTEQQAKDLAAASVQRGGGIWRVADARVKLPPADAKRAVEHFLDQHRELRSSLSDETKARLIADAGSGVLSLGKLLLLDRIWQARFALGNAPQRDRMRAYVGRDVFKD